MNRLFAVCGVIPSGLTQTGIDIQASAIEFLAWRENMNYKSQKMGSYFTSSHFHHNVSRLQNIIYEILSFIFHLLHCAVIEYLDVNRF